MGFVSGIRSVMSNRVVRKATSLLYPGTSEMSELVLTDYFLHNQAQKYYKQSYHAVDIGAAPPPNYYELFLKYVGNVYCVEPALSTSGNPFASHIHKLLSLEKRNKVKLFNGVISDVSGPVIFHQGQGNTINSSLNPAYRLDSIEDVSEYMESFSPVSTQSLTYADYIKQNHINKNLLFVKVDVEGAEDKVLSTMDWSNSPRILLLEVAYETGNLKDQVCRLMKSTAFRDSLFIRRRFDDCGCDVVGEFYFNELDDELLTSGSLFLAQADVIKKKELLALRRDVLSRMRMI